MQLGKICPRPLVEDEQAWKDFKEGVEYFMRYQTIEEVPEWGKQAVQEAIDEGILKGTGKGLGISETELKVLVWLSRAGVI